MMVIKKTEEHRVRGKVAAVGWQIWQFYQMHLHPMSDGLQEMIIFLSQVDI